MAKAGETLNNWLMKLFEPGLSNHFEFSDFKGLTATLKPESVGEGGDRAAARDRRLSWHYACWVSNWRDFAPGTQQPSAMGRPRRLMVIAQHVSGSGCAEGANTPLWRMLLRRAAGLRRGPDLAADRAPIGAHARWRTRVVCGALVLAIPRK